MKVVLSWLREFAPLERSPQELADVMSDLGMAVESLDVVGEGLDDVVVARVLATRPHPGADRVQLVDVDAGGEPLQIVCGAFNMTEGDLVPLATIGARLPNGMEIARRKVRGEWSNGMLCAPDEIGLAGSHEGIHLLPADLHPGTPLREALGIDTDAVFDLEINPNRPDAMGHVGVARDVAARLGEPFTTPEPKVAESGDHPATELASVEVVDPDLCGRFTARVLRSVTIGPSPAWLATRLALAGMRPISNVVDISNYVMLELGQPTHAYDLDTLPGRGLRVRRARPGETLVTLDDVERTFTADDLLICDAEDTAVGIAGIMGGASTEISAGTREVLLEVAWFQAMSIARTSKRLNLRTEASARFERGADHEMTARATDRFCELLAETGVAVAPGRIDVRGPVPAPPPVRLRTGRVNAVLGTDLDVATVRRLLEPIGFACDPTGTDLDVTIPSWRPDTGTEIDVIEEVARHHGYDRIPRTVPSKTARFGRLTPYQLDRRRVRQILVGAGVDEAWNSPFLAPEDLTRAGLPDDALEVTNPLAVEESRLRTSLLPGMLRTIAYNASHRNHGVHLFEIGHVFRRPVDPGAELPDERELLAVALAGSDATEAAEVWATLVDGLLLEGARLVSGTAPGMHPTRTARVVVAGDDIGAVGEVDPSALAAFDIDERVAWIEVDLERLLTAPHDRVTYRPISRYPSSDVDLAFAVDDATPVDVVAQTLRDAGGDLLTDLRLFDVYRGPGVEAGRRSLAFTLRFQAADRTLTDEEVADARRRCIEAVESAHPATLRG